MTKWGQTGIKIVYNYNNEDYVIAGVEKIKPVRVGLPHLLTS